MATQTLTIQIPDARYLDKLMGMDSFVPLAGLFRRAHSPAKELTESYSALHHLRQYMRGLDPVRVIHVGDGGLDPRFHPNELSTYDLIAKLLMTQHFEGANLLLLPAI